MRTKHKRFDAVRMMRDIRDSLHKEYENDPKKREKDLIRVRKKYMRSKIASH